MKSYATFTIIEVLSGSPMDLETHQSDTIKFKKHFTFILLTTFIFIICFGVYTFELVSRLSDIEKSVQQHNNKMIKINTGIYNLNKAMGYGGYIHNFKNYLIRNDQQTLSELSVNIQSFKMATEQLSSLFTQSDELEAIKTINTTLDKYQLNLVKLQQFKDITNIEYKDLIVKVDDQEALQAIEFLSERTKTLNQSHLKFTEQSFENISLWIMAGISIFLFAIFFAIFLLNAVKKLKYVYTDLAKALHESDLLIANSPDAMLSITEAGIMVRCNEQLESLFGYTKDELLQQDMSMLLPQNVKHKHQAHLNSYFHSPHRRLMGEGVKQLYGQDKYGRLIPIEVSLSSSVISGVKISTATIRDISARIEAEDKLKIAVELAESNYLKLQKAQISLNEKQMINIMLNKLPFCTLLLDGGKLLIVNEKALIETGYSQLQLEQLEFEQYIKVDDEKYRNTLTNLIKGKPQTKDENLTFLGTLVTNQLAVIPIEIYLSTYLYDEQLFTLISFKNLTEIRVIEEKLVNSVERFTRVISAIEDGIWEWDIINNTVDYSPQLMKIIGRENEPNPEFIHWFDHIHPDYKDTVNTALSAHLETKEKYEVEYLGLNETGEYNWFFSIGDSSFDKNNRPVLMSGSLRNIHNKKLLEIALIEKSQFLNTIYEGSSHAIWVLNVETNNELRIVNFNRAACARLSVQEQDVIDKTLSELSSVFESTNLLDFVSHYLTCIKSAKQIDYIENLHFNDQNGWYKTSLYPIANEQGEVIKVVGTAIDITEQKRSEKALEDNQLFLEKILDSTVCGLYVFNFDLQKNVTINQRYTEILGYNMDELNQNEDFMSLFHPDDLPAVIEHMTKVAESKNGELYSLKYRFKNKGGSWVWCYSFDCIVKYNENNMPLLMLGTFVDITELTFLMEQLQESNDYLKRFAFVASHDLQEPLRKITAFSSSLKNKLKTEIEKDDSIEFEFSRLINASERMREMIKDLLKLSKINSSALDIKQCYLSDILKQVVDLLSHLIEEHQVEFQLIDTDVKLFVDEGLMIQLFQNLMANSIKFMDKDVKPIIQISSHKKTNDLIIKFKDNGIGIEDKFADQIFEPFRRLHNKDQYSGSGIGLALCRQIVAIHNGTIDCSRNVKQGAVFIITLPQVVN
ncbi:PAS domain S-box protein [Psychrosphaera aquimarina]|uniref:histidine kinase n=1 Tax=Psychrosphaera aquimarina TaxID=2044854 RepID=A0ABU3R0B0_9GAMM|nr:PAS domain S-box protein [Psychrosphaera aquimarina]MDU0113103.1 PAS domain S-box protein [Psychrosphaera aquimarina]